MVAGAWTMGAYALSTNDIITVDGKKYKVAGENLITNPGFENGFTGWTGAKDFTTEITSDGFTLKTPGQDGAGSYLVGTANDGSTGAKSIGTAWEIEKGKTYAFGYFIKPEGTATGTGYVKSSLTNTKGKEEKELGIPTVKPGEWVEFQKVFTNTDHAYCQVLFRWLNGQWGFDNFFLGTVVEMPNTEALQAVITDAETLYGTGDGKAAADLKTAIDAAKEKLNSESADEVNAAVAALNAAISAYNIVNATEDNPANLTSFIINPSFENGTTGWTLERNPSNGGDVKMSSTAPSDGSNQYNIWFDKLKSIDLHQEIADMPAGKYRLAADFRIDNQNLVTDQGVYATVARKTVKSGTITKVAENWQTVEGWNNLTVDFNVIEKGSIRLGASSTGNGNSAAGWFQIDNFTLQYMGALSDDELAEIYKEELTATIAEAEAKAALGVGEGIFQYPEAGVAELKKAIEDAKAATEAEAIKTANTTLKAAMAAYDESKELTAPAEGDVFNVTITTDDNYKFKDIPLSFNSDGKGGVDLYPANKGMGTAHLATYVTFKKVADKKDCFTMSTVFADGTERFVSTGQTSGNGNSTVQVRLTDDPAKALAVQVIPTATEGVYNLFNTEANNTLGCQDGDDKAKGGLYTTPAHNTFVLTKVDKYTVTLNINEETGYETLILPFKAEIPDGLQVYTVAGTKDATEADDADYVLLELAEVTDGIAANTPYIVKGQGEFKFQGVGAAYGPEYAGERLVGTFVEKEAPAEAFVMDNQGPNFGFYPVTVAEPAEPTDPEPAEPTEPASAPAKAAAANKIVAANHAYMTVPDGETAAAKAYVFVAVPTGVDVIDMTSDELVDVYTLGGVVVRKAVPANEALQGLGKGIYIVGGAKIVK